MTNKKIAVIGAGFSGLTAAYRLNQHGLDVDVFEARNRIGGRVFTVLMTNYLGLPSEVELGGQNITDGGEATNLLNLIDELKLKIQQKIININQLVSVGDRHDYFDKLVQGNVKKVQELYKLTKKVNNIGNLIDLFCEDNILLKQALLTRMCAYEGVNAYQQSIYHNIETLECTLAGGVAKCHEYYEHQQNQVVTSSICGGNASLAIEMSKSLKGLILYNKSLSKIIMNENSVTLQFNDHSVYNYDYVILAIPAATFKNVDFSLSQIDQPKLNKMESISYGSNYKIALPLDLAERNSISSVVKNDIISFYNHGDSIQLLYANTAQASIDDFLKILAKACNINIEQSQTIMKVAEEQNYANHNQGVYHDWKQDRYSQGSYAGYSISLSKELDQLSWHDGIYYKSLFTPKNNVLFFAGEHTTILECIGTMEAAVEAGERIAKAIIKKIQK